MIPLVHPAFIHRCENKGTAKTERTGRVTVPKIMEGEKMMLSERQKEALNDIENLRKRIDLLDSHKVVGYINDKQYAESLKSISDEVDRLEKEFGIQPGGVDAREFLYEDGIKKFSESVSVTDNIFEEGISGDDEDGKLFI